MMRKIVSGHALQFFVGKKSDKSSEKGGIDTQSQPKRGPSPTTVPKGGREKGLNASQRCLHF